MTKVLQIYTQQESCIQEVASRVTEAPEDVIRGLWAGGTALGSAKLTPCLVFTSQHQFFQLQRKNDITFLPGEVFKHTWF